MAACGGGSPEPTEETRETPVPAVSGEGSPVPAEEIQETPVPTVSGEGSPVPEEETLETPVPTVSGEGSPVPEEETLETPVPTVSGEGSPVPTEEIQETPVPTGEVREALPPAANRIVYVGGDTHIYTVDPNGLNKQQMTTEVGFYTWPTWSPDGASLLFSGALGDPLEADTLGLYTMTMEQREAKRIYTNIPIYSPLIAPGAVHYLIWSPDSQKVAFLARTPAGQSYYFDDPKNDVTPQYIADGAPFYSAWSPSSRYLLFHVGMEHFLLDFEDDQLIRNLGIQSRDYRTPDWSPESDRIAFIAEDESGNSALFTADLDGQDRRRLADIPDTAAFLWDPKGESIALSRSSDRSDVFLDGLDLISLDTLEQRTVVKEMLLSFFWSPDGSKIAYFSPGEEQGDVWLAVLDVETGAHKLLANFIPTPEMLTMLLFFDQYAYSHLLWSPDSNSLVISGVLKSPSLAQLSDQIPPRIYVIDVTGVAAPTIISDGFLAFWSKR